MELIQSFRGVFYRGFQGNVIYSLPLPPDLKTLSVLLTYDKEQAANKKEYKARHEKDLLPILERYCGRPVEKEELEKFTAAMKTEIQLCLMVNGSFAGNVHMPGTRKEIRISAECSSRGCLPCPHLEGMARIIINVFQIVEDETQCDLVVKGEFQDVEAD